MILRWLRFNTVGIAGALVQLAALWIFARVLGVQYLPATVIAVEIAVLHNFAWHEAWTWQGMARNGRARRLLRFHLGNGLVSIISNPLFTWLFVQWVGLPLLMANLAAIICAALVNFMIAELWVFAAER